MPRLDFDIAVFAVNEAPTLAACIASIDRACAGCRGHISVLLNGTADDSLAILDGLRLDYAALSVYFFPVADKSNAINHFLYNLRHEATAHFGIDAYTRIGPHALQAIVDAFAAQPAALIASGVPVTGRTANAVVARTLAGGAVNGQLYGLRPDFVDRMVEARLRLPVQLYWGDGLLGSMAAHDLDALANPWDERRVIGVASGTFAITPLSVFRWRDLRRQYNREVRQACGRVQNAAIKSIVYQDGYAALPPNANEMAATWLKTNRIKPRSLRERYFLDQAVRQINGQRVGISAPELVFSRE